MSKYKLLPAHLHTIADAAETLIKAKYGLAKAIVESPIDPNISWSPTMHWKTRTGYIACEVHENPHPTVLKTVFGDGTAIDIPLKIIVAHPANQTMSQSEYIRASNETKKFGFALLAMNDNKTGAFQHEGIEISLYLAVPKYSNYDKKLRSKVQHAFELYINGDPRHGVQEVGQLVEEIIKQVAIQAKSLGKLVSGKFNPGKYYKQSLLIEDLIKDKILDKGFLTRCRVFADDRNSTSHKAKDIKEAIKLNRKLKNQMTTGLQILEDAPDIISKSKYKLVVT